MTLLLSLSAFRDNLLNFGQKISLNKIRRSLTSWKKEFPHFPDELGVLIPEGFLDYSWHDGGMPFFINEDLDIGLWIDHPNAKERMVERFQGRVAPKQFILEQLENGMLTLSNDSILLETDSFSDIENFLLNYTKSSFLKDNRMASLLKRA